jgi:hypothetical protein
LKRTSWSFRDPGRRPYLAGFGVGAHAGDDPGPARGSLVVPESLGCEHGCLMAAGDDLAAGLDDHFVFINAFPEIFEFGAESGSLFAALLGDAEVSQDVAAGVADQAGEVHQEVVGGSFGT